MIDQKTMLAVFTYTDQEGKEREWTVGCVFPQDNREKMLDHFRKWMPDKKLVSLVFEYDER